MPSPYSSFRQPQFGTEFILQSRLLSPQPTTVLQPQLVLGLGAGFRRLAACASLSRSASRGSVIATRPSPSKPMSSTMIPVRGSCCAIARCYLSRQDCSATPQWCPLNASVYSKGNTLSNAAVTSDSVLCDPDWRSYVRLDFNRFPVRATRR